MVWVLGATLSYLGVIKLCKLFGRASASLQERFGKMLEVLKWPFKHSPSSGTFTG